MELFQVNHFSFSYPEQTKPVLDGIDLTVHYGEFLVLCGPSGCGKSTLLRHLKTVLAPHGQRSGEILFQGRPLEDIEQSVQSRKIGYVLQSPDDQIVTDKVWHELAFGLESLGYDTPTIRRRVAEMASFFGIEGWFYKNVEELSGGQKQLLNLASVMAMQPKVLILDEPTSQLDPIAASDFLATLGKINRELGTTVILTEHRLEEAFPLASRVAVMDRGKLLYTGPSEDVGQYLRQTAHGMFLAMPAAMRLWAAVPNEDGCPVTVREGREWLARYCGSHTVKPLPAEAARVYEKEPVLRAEDLWFKYEKDAPDVVRGLSIEVKKGEFVALLGGNGTGKTTGIKLLGGILAPQRGQVECRGRVGMLPQNPQTLFVKKTVREDLFEILKGKKFAKAYEEEKVSYVVSLCRLEELLDRHPYDLSGGEQQRAALAKVLLLDPEILLLDEPTKGLDAEFKQVFAEILRALLSRGVAVVMVSHDIEFCARWAHRCALFFDGDIVAQGTPRTFFSGNSFYTTPANRMARGFVPDAVTTEELIFCCGGSLPDGPELPREIPPLPRPPEDSKYAAPPGLPWWRRLGAVLTALIAAALFLRFMTVTDLSAIVTAEGNGLPAREQLLSYLIFLGDLFAFALFIGRKSKVEQCVLAPTANKKLPKRTVAAAVLIILLIPLTLLLGERYLEGRKYYFISLLILLECMLPFFLVFESRKPQARELVVIAALCALCVAGRAALFMLPHFKPVIALVIISAVAFGGEAGFLVGAMTMLVSNFLFSQGPWTPWQMFAMGIIGFLAGVLFRKGLLRRTRMSLCVFGAIASILVYGGIMNLQSALQSGAELNAAVLLSYYITGFPMDCVQAASTFFFLWFAAEPMLEKLDRIKVKYGMVE